MGASVTVKLKADEFDNLRSAVKMAMDSVRREMNALQKKAEAGVFTEREANEAKERIHETRQEYRRWEQILTGPLG